MDLRGFLLFLKYSLGTESEITFSYIDDEGDEICVDSELEFQEMAKSVTEGAENYLRLNITETPVGEQCTDRSKTDKVPLPTFKPKIKQMKTKLHKCKMERDEMINLFKKQDLKKEKKDERKVKPSDNNKDNVNKHLNAAQTMEESPPKWFKKYMSKFKHELVVEVSKQVLNDMKRDLCCEIHHERELNDEQQQNSNSSSNSCNKTNSHHNHSWRINLNNSQSASGGGQKKKKSSEEESSDSAVVAEHRDSKLLKKIEKFHKLGEKKYEKLDWKLEKLENKTKRLLEKKCQLQSRTKLDTVNKLRCDLSLNTYLMDAGLLEKSYKELCVEPGHEFVKGWHVMNNGNLPWNHKTELRLAWGTPGLMFDETVVACPSFKPGEKGYIVVKGRAPEYPGTFESYWHFYHMGERFGHWLDCAVIVRAKSGLRYEGGPMMLNFLSSANQDKRKLVIELMKEAESEKAISIDTMKQMKKRLEEENSVRMNQMKERLVDEDSVSLKTLNQMKEMLESDNPVKMEAMNLVKNRLMDEDFAKMEAMNQMKERLEDDDPVKMEAMNLVKKRLMDEDLAKMDTINQIKKRLENKDFVPPPPTPAQILRRVLKTGKLEFEFNDGWDADDDLADLNDVHGTNIEPAEWRELQTDPSFYNTCVLNLSTRSRDEGSRRLTLLTEQMLEELQRNSRKQQQHQQLEDKDKKKDEVDGLQINLDEHCEQFYDTEMSVSYNGKQSAMVEKLAEFLANKLPSQPATAVTPQHQAEAEAAGASAEQSPPSSTDNNSKDREYDSDSDSELSVISQFVTSSESEDDAFIMVTKGEGNGEDDDEEYGEQYQGGVGAGKCLLCASTGVDTNGSPTNEEKGVEERVEEVKNVAADVKVDEGVKTMKEVVEEITAGGEEVDEDKMFPPFVHSHDPTGKTIFAVDRYGRCVPVLTSDDRQDTRERGFGRERSPYRYTYGRDAGAGFERPPGGYSHFPSSYIQPPVEIIPNMFVNAASSAFSTARSVINNIHSAVKQRFAKLDGSVNKEDEAHAFQEAMFALYEMGFHDIELNAYLLEFHNNEINKVIESLVKCHQKSPRK